jgi:hypothetical protein
MKPQRLKRGDPQKSLSPSAFILCPPSSGFFLPFFNNSYPLQPSPHLLRHTHSARPSRTLRETRSSCKSSNQLSTCQVVINTMPPYATTPFKDLCLTLQPLNPHLRPMPAVCITALPLKDKRDPIWAEPCCLQCAKLVGSVDLYCVPHPNTNEHKCIRCYNMNITCVPIPQEHIKTFRSIQVFFRKRDLKYAFLFRRAWIVGMNNEPSARLGRQFFLVNRNIERLINTQLAIVRTCRLL